MIETSYFLIVTALLAVGTLLIRGAFIAFSNRFTVSPKLKELFTFIPAAIFPALIVPAAFFHQGGVGFLGGKERFVVLFLCGLASLWKRNTLFTIALGLLLLYLLQTIGLHS